ncbi:MAG TPA: MFS transporter [Hyphomicrobiales bacterium]|nr:MFS transporter [Hyphomicrobiales bacterium]
MDSPSPAASAPVTPAQDEAGAGLSHQRRYLIYGCILLTVFLAAMEATIAATAMPAIVGDLGGFELYSWIFSGYLVVQAATTVITGKLADLYGRRAVMVVCIAIFILASIFAGFAWSMPVLIVARVLQGFGSGGIQPVAFAIIGDLFTSTERARLQGITSSMWGIASVIAPLIGGFIVSHFSWSWIFWINVVLGLPPMLGLMLLYPEKVEHRRHQIDYLGAVLFSVSIGALIVVLVQGGSAWSWSSPEVLSLVALFAVALALFLLQERRAAEPMVALDLWRDRDLAINNTTVLVLGMALVGLSLLMPLYIQGVLGGTPVDGGYPLTAVGVSWPVASALFVRLVMLFGRHVVRVGVAIFAAGALALPFFGQNGTLTGVIVSAAAMGFGMGIVNTTCVILIQGAFDWSRRASALASNVFARIIGTAIGAAVLGGILNSGLNAHLATAHSGLSAANIRRLLEHGAAAPAGQGALLRDALFAGVHGAFLALAGLAVAAFLLSQFIKAEPAALGIDRAH